jgi:hypothetical protein
MGINGGSQESSQSAKGYGYSASMAESLNKSSSRVYAPQAGFLKDLWGQAQGVAATLGQCEVDRAATQVALEARIAALFVHVHAPAALHQQRGEHGTGQAGSDQGDVLGSVVAQTGHLWVLRLPLPIAEEDSMKWVAQPRSRQASVVRTKRSTSA